MGIVQNIAASEVTDDDINRLQTTVLWSPGSLKKNDRLEISRTLGVLRAILADARATPSGSGDHAELARLAGAATPGPWSYRDMRPNTYGPAFVDSAEVQSLAICGEAVGLSETHGFCLQVDSEVRMANAAFIAAFNPSTAKALVAEIAALRMQNEDHRIAVDTLQLEATEAERKLAEAERGAEFIARLLPSAAGLDDAPDNKVVAVYINMRELRQARTFLSKEAERDRV